MREESILNFLQSDSDGYVLAEGRLNAVADAAATRILAAGDAGAPAGPIVQRVEAEGLSVTGSAVEATWYFDHPGAGVFPTGGPILNERLKAEAPGYAEALDNGDYDYVGIGIATSGVLEEGTAEVAVSVIFVDTDAVALVDNRGSSDIFDIYGSLGPDEILGTDAGERIFSGELFRGQDLGGDVVRAGGGDDEIWGDDLYADTLIGGDGDDTYWYPTYLYNEDGPDVIVEEVDGGTDTIVFEGEFSLEGYANVENLTAWDVVVGNELGNTLRAIFNSETVFDGKAGDDTMIGSRGSDLFIVDSAGDMVIEEGRGARGSHDVVRAYTDYTLDEGQRIEQLELRRVRDEGGEVVQDVSATGNEFGNRIIGNGQRNALEGGAGDDELIGAGGTDILTGGAGADVFRFTERPGADGPDRITDFESGTDRIWLDAGALGVDLGDADFVPLKTMPELVRLGTEAQDADDLLIWDAGTRTGYVDIDGAGGIAPVALIAFDEGGDTPMIGDVWLV
ncbi:RTX toxin (plasmid) [Wenxinia marina DSM 24838]|uniref:RTX toxin n=4 Tax=Wenxinia TaxID=653686 RepID=A0A0D0QK68_9RHOB|nr:RTX toxin [Wenxinia marina DSM 24838]